MEPGFISKPRDVEYRQRPVGVSPDKVCRNELVAAYVVPIVEPSSLCMAKAAFLADLSLVE